MDQLTTKIISPYQLTRWNCLKYDEIVVNRFVFMLAPILEYIYQSIKQKINNLPVVAELMQDFNLASWLKKDLCKIFQPIIVRSCVLEMHYAKARGCLLGATPEDRFQFYIDMLAEPIFVTSFIEKYPVLQNLIDRRSTHYLYALEIFLQHLNNDFMEVSEKILKNNKILKLVNISSDGADFHCQGKRVFILEFIDQNKVKFKLVYKPHHVEPENIFNNIIEWFNQYVDTAQLLKMELINKGDHGWVKFIEHLPCSNETEIKLFYRRAGYLLMLLYWLHGLDIHCDNIIAHGAYPVIVDLECFLTPEFKKKSENYSLPTVLDSLFLPMRYGSDDGNIGIDISALGFVGKKNYSSKIFSWEKIGTDEMHFVRTEAKTSPSKNQPFLKEVGDTDYLKYTSELISGFTYAYKIILEQKNNFLTNEKIINQLKKLSIRLLFRPTENYATLLMESYHPSLLKDPKKYQEHFFWLENKILEYPEFKKLLKSELLDLNSGDIPFFSCNSGGKVVFNSYYHATKCKIISSGWDYFYYRFSQVFSSQDCDKQKYFIDMSFSLAKINNHNQENYNKSLKKPSIVWDKVNYCIKAREYAEIILDKLTDLALIEYPNIVWPEVIFEQDNQYVIYTPGVTAKNLYSGILGIFLVFLLGQKEFKKPSYQNIIDHCFATIKITVDKISTQPWLEKTGVFSGAAGILYVLTYARDLDYDIDEALEHTLLEHIKNNLTKDNQYDLDGTAGVILVLVKMYQQKPSDFLEKIITQSVKYLLEAYPDPLSMPESWAEKNSAVPLGLLHGITGIALAFWRAKDIFSNSQTMQWIELALDYVKKIYIQHQCIPDVRKKGQKKLITDSVVYLSRWCRGCVGIGLFYLELQKTQSSLVNLIDLNAVINNIQIDENKNNVGYLCCGTLSEIEFLLAYYHYQSSDQVWALLETRIKKLYNCLDQGNYSAYAAGQGFANNLMQGKAGIAYILLQLTCNQSYNLLLLK